MVSCLILIKAVVISLITYLLIWRRIYTGSTTNTLYGDKDKTPRGKSKSAIRYSSTGNTEVMKLDFLVDSKSTRMHTAGI